LHTADTHRTAVTIPVVRPGREGSFGSSGTCGRDHHNAVVVAPTILDEQRDRKGAIGVSEKRI